MKKTTIGILALGICLAAFGTASAATNTVSWSPVTKYTDGSTISGESVSYSIHWSNSSSMSSAATIATGVTGTSRTFDPSALGMGAGSTVYIAMKASLSGGTSGYSTAKSWTVPSASVSKTLSGISIGGASSINEGSTGSFTATASWSDGSTTTVTPTWSLSSTTYASISSAGLLTAKTVSSAQSVTVNASYASGGVTKTAGKTVAITNVAATLSGIAIGGASSVAEGATGSYAATASWSDGSTTTVTPTWSLSSTTYASISSAGLLTAKTVSSAQSVTVNASYASGGVTKTAVKTVAISDGAATLSGIAISGISSVYEGATATYTAKASWSDGTTTTIIPTWSLSSATYASINSSGLLTAKSVSSNQSVTVNAGYSSGGVTKTAGKTVTIANAEQNVPDAPEDSRISKPGTLAADTWRLSWDDVTTYVNGSAIPSSSTVLYQAYWTRDPNFASDNLVSLSSPVAGKNIDFQPQSLGMVRGERIYFLVRAILGSGEKSAFSDYVPWRAWNREPTSPFSGRISGWGR